MKTGGISAFGRVGLHFFQDLSHWNFEESKVVTPHSCMYLFPLFSVSLARILLCEPAFVQRIKSVFNLCLFWKNAVAVMHMFLSDVVRFRFDG